MLIKFLDNNGNSLTSSVVNIGIKNNIILGLTIDGQGSTQSISGNILKNSSKIGDFTWSPAEGTITNWYMGEGRPIYVLDKDTISATNGPTITIERTIPDIENTVSLSEINNKLGVMVPNVSTIKRIKSVIDLIKQETALVYSQCQSINVSNIKNYLLNDAQLPSTEAQIYSNITELNTALNTLVPPTLRQIFDSWARFSYNEYYTDPSKIPDISEAKAWYWDDTQKSAVMPLNSNTFNGFLSKELVDYYDHEVTLSSPNFDDDWNGVVLCFKNINGINYSLSVVASCDASGATTGPIVPNLNIRYHPDPNGNHTLGETIASNSANDIRNGWLGKTKRIKVLRRGDFFTILASNWSSTQFNPALTMTLDLNSDPRFEIFKAPTQYGYCNCSQADSTFKNIKYFGGVLRDTIIDAVNNEVYRYIVNNGWMKLTGVTAKDVYGAPRVIIGEDSKRYQINLDGTITVL